MWWIRTKEIGWFVVAVLMSTGFGRGADAADAADVLMTFTLDNQSNVVILGVLAGPDYTFDWARGNLLGSALPPRHQRLFNVHARTGHCSFNIVVSWDDRGGEIFRRAYRGLNLCEDTYVTFDGGRGLVISNKSRTSIKGVRATPTEREWGPNRLDEDEFVDPGGKKVIMLRLPDGQGSWLDEQYKDHCIFDIRLRTEESVVEYRQRNLCDDSTIVFDEDDLANDGGPDGGAPTAPVVPREDLTVGETFRDCEGRGCPWMVVVDGGAFERGSWERDEAPVTKVTVPGPFAVGQFEVSVGQFEEFARDTGHDGGNACYIKARRGWRLKKGQGEWQLTEGRSWGEPGFDQDDSHPVVCVSWDDAIAYTGWLAERTAMPYRLLTEAEAEWLATASATNFERSGRANCRNCGSPWDGKGTSPIGRMPPDDLGLHDVFGNAAEWVQDCYQSGYGNAPRDGSAWSPPSCGRRVVRGGCWLTSAQKLRASGRDSGEPDRRSSCVGFRVARDLGKE